MKTIYKYELTRCRRSDDPIYLPEGAEIVSFRLHGPGQYFIWAAQLREYPNSIRISNKDMLIWIDKAPLEKQARMWKKLAMYLTNYPNGVFYRTSDAPDAFVGFRFGLDGGDYFSGWTLYNYEWEI